MYVKQDATAVFRKYFPSTDKAPVPTDIDAANAKEDPKEAPTEAKEASGEDTPDSDAAKEGSEAGAGTEKEVSGASSSKQAEEDFGQANKEDLDTYASRRQ